MNYDFIAIPDQDVPQATDPLFQHLVTTYASETNKTASMWRAIPDDLLDFKPHEKVNTIRAILVHQILSERRFFAQFVGIRGTTGGGATASWRSAAGASLPGPVRHPGEEAAAPACRGERRVVADRDAVLRWAETAANLDVLAACPSYLPPSDTDPDMAAAGWSACPSDLRTIRGCEVGRG